MKKIIVLALILTNFVTFAQSKNDNVLGAYSSKAIENAVIYEVNIRQYSPEGTFDAFTKDIPVLKKLGVKILWLMPIHPIGVENRKEGLGSYYSVKDYRGVNPEFGKLANFQKLVKAAHKNGMYVILDWVPNHSAWDHSWVKAHPEYYAKDAAGKLISPFDWTDVVKFDYSNKNMRKAMVSDMNYWLTTANVDGFRCDVAGEVPTDFWADAIKTLRKTRPAFLLAEAEKPELLKNGFDMHYGWEEHHIMNGIAQGKKTVKDFDEYIKKMKQTLEKDDVIMNMTSNHDENTWSGTEYERLADAVEVFAAMTYCIPGMPLIYNGQEYDFNRRLKFFEKDQITKEKGKMFAIYEKLSHLKNKNEALNGGKNAATYKRLSTSNDENILTFEREKNGKKIVFIANLSKTNQSFSSPVDGTYTDYMNAKKLTLKKGQTTDFAPWEYKILVML